MIYSWGIYSCQDEQFVIFIVFVFPFLSLLVWFTANAVGKNTLGNTVKKLCSMAGIEGHYTNHSLRATTATRGLVNGIPEKIVMERTGHRDVRSLQKYRRLDVAKKVEYTKLFDRSPALDEKKDKKEGKGHEPVCETVVKRKDVEKLGCASDDGEKEEGRRVCFENCTFMIRENFNVE